MWRAAAFVSAMIASKLCQNYGILIPGVNTALDKLLMMNYLLR